MEGEKPLLSIRQIKSHTFPKCALIFSTRALTYVPSPCLRKIRPLTANFASTVRTVARLITDAIDRGPLPPEWLAQKEVRDQLLLAITELMAPEQNVIYRFYFAGESYKELAEASGISVRSVEGRLYRARAELRRKLAHLADA